MLSQTPGEERGFATLLARVLRSGVMLAAALVICGGALYLFRRGDLPADYKVFRGEPPQYRTVFAIVEEAKGGSGRGLIQLGLLVLIATPILRVISSVIAFARERDWLYVLITIVVLALLSYSLLAA